MRSDDLTAEQFRATARYLFQIARQLMEFEDRMGRKSFPRSDFLMDGVLRLREQTQQLAAECDYRALTAK